MVSSVIVSAGPIQPSREPPRTRQQIAQRCNYGKIHPFTSKIHPFMGWQCLVLNHLHGADLVGHFDVGRHDGDALSLAVDVI